MPRHPITLTPAPPGSPALRQQPLWLPVVAISVELVAVNPMYVGALGTFEY